MLAVSLYAIASDIVMCPPTGLAINVTPLMRYYQGAENFFALCQQTLRTQRVSYHYGCGATIEIAQLLAHTASDQLQDNEQASIAIGRCALLSTQLSVKHTEQLHRSGIRTVKQLLQLPLEELGKRFSNDLINYVLALKAVKAPPYVKFHPKPEFKQFLELPFAIETTPPLSRYFSKLIEQLCRYVQARNMVTDTLSLALIQQDHESLAVSIKAGSAHYHVQEWLALLELKLEQLQLESPVTAIRLCCDTLYEFNPDTQSLLATHYTKHAENMLLGKLLAKLGNDTVATPQASNDYRFEVTEMGARQSGQPFHPDHNAQQPSWLIDQPQPLVDESRVIYGPERVHTGWWDEQAVKRDYFIVETLSGQRLWVFRDEQQHWYIHGYFS